MYETLTLKEKAVRSVGWLAFAKIVGQGFQLGVTIILARILSPNDYGLVGMAALMTGFLAYFNELGLGAAIIQKKELSDHELNSVFWFAILVSVFLYILTYAVSPFVEVFFKTAGLTLILRVLALDFIIAALKIVPLNTLSRAVDFRDISKSEVISFFVSGICSVMLALMGFGVWALVFGTLIFDACYTLLILLAVPWRIRWVFKFGEVAGMLTYGAAITGSRLLYYLYTSADTLIVGKVLGAGPLGFYSMATRLSRLAIDKISAVVNQVSFPVFSAVQDDVRSLSRSFLKVNRLIAMVTFPLMGGGILVAKELVTVVLTSKWLPIVVSFQLLCLIGIPRSIHVVMAHVLNARGRAKFTFKYSLIAAAVLPTAFLVGVRYGITGVAAGWLAVEPILMVYMLTTVLKEIRMPLRNFLGNLSAPFFASVAMAVLVIAVKVYAGLMDYSPAAVLAATITSGVVGYVSIIMVFCKNTVADMKSVLSAFRVTPPADLAGHEQ